MCARTSGRFFALKYQRAFQNVCFETNKMDPYILALMEGEELEEIFVEDVEMEDVDGKF